MTNFDRYLAKLKPDDRREVLRWVESRPPKIRALCHRFPPGWWTMIKGRKVYVIGFAETADQPGVYWTYIDPRRDYEGAMAAKFFLCGAHLPEQTP
jgi:hypothetical protein